MVRRRSPSPARVSPRSDRPAGSKPGAGLDPPLRSRLERGFATRLDDLRVNDTAASSSVLGSAGRGATVGANLYFGANQYRPGTVIGDLLVAHEVAHALQQRSAGPSASPGALEREADRAALHVVAGRGGAAPALSATGGLRLQRCTSVEAPSAERLREMSASEQAAWITREVGNDSLGMTSAVMQVLQQAASTGEFVAVQRHLDMPHIFRTLKPWTAVRIGALGPITDGTAELNQARMTVIEETTHELGPGHAEVFTLFIFNSTQDDQVRDVLRRLAADNRYADTIGQMPTVQAALRDRGIAWEEVHDRPEGVGDFFRGIGTAISDMLGSSEAARGGRSLDYLGRRSDMPEAYQTALSQLDEAAFTQAMTPGNVALGTLDYVAFNIPSGLYHTMVGTGRGIGNLFTGDYDSAGRNLFPALLIVGTVIGVRMLRGRPAAGAAAVEGEAALTLPEARALLTAEGVAVADALIAEIGEAGVVRAAEYVRSSRAAAVLAQEHGLAGVRALVAAEGNIAAAEALLLERVEAATVGGGRLHPPSHRGGGFHGTDEIPPSQAFTEGLPARGTNPDLLSHAEAGGNSAFRGTTPTPMSPTGEAGAAHWAGEGGWVYDIRGVATWDVNALLEGRRAVAGGLGGFGGNLMVGELESAIPARVPATSIRGAYPVVEGRGGSLRLGPFEANPNYRGSP